MPVHTSQGMEGRKLTWRERKRIAMRKGLEDKMCGRRCRDKKRKRCLEKGDRGVRQMYSRGRFRIRSKTWRRGRRRRRRNEIIMIGKCLC